MAEFVMEKSPPLRGETRVQRAKNAVLPMMACAVLTDEELEIAEAPRLTDVEDMATLLRGLGVRVERAGNGLRLCGADLKNGAAEDDAAERMRASVLLLGPLLARLGRARLRFPGGCAIGSRPIDLHIKGLRAMGARFSVREGCVEGAAEGLRGASVYLDFPSVGATENLLLAAALARGTTVIEGAAKEPEVADLVRLLRRMGAKIAGLGQSRLTVEGVPALHGARCTPMPDRIEAGTLLLCAAATGGDVLLRGAQAATLGAVIAKLQESGAQVHSDRAGLRVRGGPLRGVDVETLVYPGFPTDLQAPMMALLCRAEGTSILTEHIFENRFLQVPQLRRMGASIAVRGRTAVIRGVETLHGARVAATDLRAGAALVLAGLTAEGRTEITDIAHIERGYVDLVGALRSLGAPIERRA